MSDLAEWIGDGLVLVFGAMQVPVVDARMQRIIDKRVEQVKLFGIEVGRFSDLDADEILERLASNPDVVDLFVRITDELHRTTLEGKRRAFARVLASALRDDTVIDTARLLERAIENLDSVHFRALAIIAAGPADHIERDGNQVTGGTSVERLAEQAPGPAGVHHSIAATLASNGLVRDVAIGGWGYSEPSWGVTDFGREFLALVDD